MLQFRVNRFDASIVLCLPKLQAHSSYPFPGIGPDCNVTAVVAVIVFACVDSNISSRSIEDFRRLLDVSRSNMLKEASMCMGMGGVQLTMVACPGVLQRFKQMAGIWSNVINSASDAFWTMSPHHESIMPFTHLNSFSRTTPSNRIRSKQRGQKHHSTANVAGFCIIYCHREIGWKKRSAKSKSELSSVTLDSHCEMSPLNNQIPVLRNLTCVANSGREDRLADVMKLRITMLWSILNFIHVLIRLGRYYVHRWWI